MLADLPPQTFMRVLSSQYLDAYVDGEFCATTEKIDSAVPTWRVDVNCPGGAVSFLNLEGLVVAVLPWENWRLAVVG